MITTRPLLAALVLALVSTGCAMDGALVNEVGGADSGWADDQAPPQLRLDVYPSDATPDLEPQSVSLGATGDWSGVQVEVSPSVRLAGIIEGYLATPYLSGPVVPGEDDQPIAAQVTVRRDDSVAGGTATTDAEGGFELTLPPGQGYRVEIVPVETDRVPFSVQSIPVLASDLDMGQVYLDYAAPVYGQVTYRDGTVPVGARVHLVDPATDAEGPETVVDAGGWYLLRAFPGDYTLVVEGREGTGVPTIRRTVTVSETDGAEVDVDVGPSARVDVGGFLIDSLGDALVSGDVDWRYTVRCRALDLRDVDGELVVEDYTTAGGRFDLKLAPGTWKAELIPPYESTLSPRTQILELGDEDVELGDLTLADRVELSLVVVDPNGQPAPQVTVLAQELAYGGYTFTATSDAHGRVTLEVPQTLLELTLTPPEPYAAITRLTIDAAETVPTTLAMVQGKSLAGVLRSEGAPVPFALVEARDTQGRLYGTTLSDGDGLFSMRVDSEPSDVQQ